MNLPIVLSSVVLILSVASTATLSLSLVNAPYLTFQGMLIPNNSQVQIRRVGSIISGGVQCHTDLTTCCNETRGGQWSIAGGGAVSQNTGFGQGLISLHSITGASTGIYRCDIDTDASVASGGPRAILFVGIYQGS